jgi:hypothetical protein
MSIEFKLRVLDIIMFCTVQCGKENVVYHPGDRVSRISPPPRLDTCCRGPHPPLKLTHLIPSFLPPDLFPVAALAKLSSSSPRFSTYHCTLAALPHSLIPRLTPSATTTSPLPELACLLAIRRSSASILRSSTWCGRRVGPARRIR